MEAARIVRHLSITGRVQGVGYRASFERRALALGLAGWVRNRFDGSVEAVIAGDPENISEMIAWSRHGPSTAQVDHVAVSDYSDSVGTAFVVMPTD